MLFVLNFVSVWGESRIVLDSARINGQNRRFRMLLPTGLKPGAPVVFVLHGYGNDGSVNTWMNNVAEREGFAVCVPECLLDPNGKPAWNVGYVFQQGWKVDDVDAMCKMARIVQKKYRLSVENTFLTGMSNGGEMCYLLAYRNQTTFKALASLAGLTMTWMYRDLNMVRPVPFLEIHGTEDRTSEWYGDEKNAGGWGAYIPVPIAVGKVIAVDGCYIMSSDTISSRRGLDGHKTVCHAYLNPETKNEVLLYEVIGAPHCWFTEDVDTGLLVWNFFKKYLR